jgi:hypothetical protein
LVITRKKVRLLNIFETIQKLQKMVITKTNKLFMDKNTGKLKLLSKHIKRLAEEQ